MMLMCSMLVPVTSAAAEQLCDTRDESCRAALLRLILAERQGIDVAFWFMQDERYVDALISRKQAGVPVRVIVDSRTIDGNSRYAAIFDRLRAAGMPMRIQLARSHSDLLHGKMVVFAGQNVLGFSAANSSLPPVVPRIDGVNHAEGVVFLTENSSLTNSFRTRFEDLWTDTTGSIGDYANLWSAPERVYGVFPRDPALNFAPGEDYAIRAIRRYERETVGIDVVTFRVTDPRHADAMIGAQRRGVTVRLTTERQPYRDDRFLWHAYNIDRMHAAGIQVEDRTAGGVHHQHSVVLRGLREVIFGSSTWSPGEPRKAEHNLFTTPMCESSTWCDAGGWVFQWFSDQFNTTWNATAESKPFVPLPPDPPASVSPARGATGVSTAHPLTWQGGSWAHLYDVYLGTDPDNLRLVVRGAKLGGPAPGQLESLRPSMLLGSTTYYWRVVSRTMAGLSSTGDTWHFTTEQGSSPGSTRIASTGFDSDVAAAVPEALAVASGALSAGDIVLWAGDTAPVGSDWSKTWTRWGAGGYKLYNQNIGAAITTAPVEKPSSYFELSFAPKAGKDYRIWIRAAADNDHYDNDSAWLQFNNSLVAGQPAFRIGSASGLNYTLQNCSGAPIAAVGWSDAGSFSSCTAGTGILVRFDTSISPTRIRIQKRQDGIHIDQIVIAAASTGLPGAMTNDTTPPYPRNSVDNSGTSAPQLQQPAPCSGCRSLQIVAHTDDDLLFMHPDLAAVVTNASAIRTIIISAGDAGLGRSYWSSREAGLKAAYARLAGVPNSWTTGTTTAAGKTLTKYTLDRATKVSLVVLRLPDGRKDASGFSSTRYATLKKLWDGAVFSLASVDGMNSFTRAELIQVLGDLTNRYVPTHLNIQDDNDLVYGTSTSDHSDHVYGSQFAKAARSHYTGAHALTEYRGYNTRLEPGNLTSAQHVAKWTVFKTYAVYDSQICISCIENNNTSGYWLWTFRQYTR